MGLFDKFKKKNKQITFIENAGGVIITKSIYEGTSKLKWLFREASVNPSDNGWRAIGDTDTQEYIDNPENSMVIDFNTLANIEPAVLAVYDMPIGTDLEFCFDNTWKIFNRTRILETDIKLSVCVLPGQKKYWKFSHLVMRAVRKNISKGKDGKKIRWDYLINFFKKNVPIKEKIFEELFYRNTSGYGFYLFGICRK